MSNQKDTLIKLEELSTRVGLLIKQYNTLAKSELLDTRLVFGLTSTYEKDDDGKAREVESFYGVEDEQWANSSSCEWQDSGCSF